MKPASTARLVAAGRIGFGIALIASPERFTTAWLGADAGRPGTGVVTRGLGARDLGLGLGGLLAKEANLTPWVAAAILADGADLVSTLAAGKALPVGGRVLVGALASSAVVLGAMALVGLRAGPKPG
jgi:hypothetical protein